MPLKSGSSKSTIASNIREMSLTHPHNVAVAAALHNAYDLRGKSTGDVRKKRQSGGDVDPSTSFDPSSTDQSSTGPLLGNTDGRDDTIDTSVPDGTHIIPSDAVSSLGDGNTNAGFDKLNAMFPNSASGNQQDLSGSNLYGNSGSSGSSTGKIKGAGSSTAGMKPPKPPKIKQMKLMQQPSMHISRLPGMPKGSRPPSIRNIMAGKTSMKSGGTSNIKNHGKVKVALSDGEFRVHPLDVRDIAGKGDIEAGHKALNAWILFIRKADIERRKKLPGPV